jgi:hypothetical protein
MKEKMNCCEIGVKCPRATEGANANPRLMAFFTSAVGLKKRKKNWPLAASQLRGAKKGFFNRPT